MDKTHTLEEIFELKIDQKKMSAQLTNKDRVKLLKTKFTKDQIFDFLRDNNVIYGINENSLNDLLTNKNNIKFPLTIAKGTSPVHGEDGFLIYETDAHEQVKVSPKQQVNFRDVIKIPVVSKGEKLAKIVEPKTGKDGKNIFGEKIPHQPGKIVTTRAGKNVVYKKENKTFYSTIDGQISMSEHLIEVQPTYVVNETLSMKTGNLDFVGSITIHGDVPTGYQVKAAGDVKIFGIVEAAFIEAGGSIYISEGLAGLQKGKIVAKEDVHLGYVNQGIIEAGGSIHVEQSIVHSTCDAKESVICKVGNIIGGSITARKTIEARDVGNRLSTKTNINFELTNDYYEQKEKALEKQNKLQARLEQLLTIGKKIKDAGALNNPKIAEMLKKQVQDRKSTRLNSSHVAI